MSGKIALLALIAALFINRPAPSQDFAKDTIETNIGNLEITFIGHGTLMFTYNGEVFHIDPWTHLADYTTLPKADYILITHDHGDHLDPKAIEAASKEETKLYLTQKCHEQLKKGQILKNGDYLALGQVPVEVVPAYNTMARKGNGRPYHPKGEGNGYILNFGGTRVYVAGDTEYYPEMEKMQMINVAFLPMNLPYTMTPGMVAYCAKILKPQILYPYHFGDTKPEALVKLMLDSPVEVRIRAMK